jgi:hypothetical protein
VGVRGSGGGDRVLCNNGGPMAYLEIPLTCQWSLYHCRMMPNVGITSARESALPDIQTNSYTENSIEAGVLLYEIVPDIHLSDSIACQYLLQMSVLRAVCPKIPICHASTIKHDLTGIRKVLCCIEEL